MRERMQNQRTERNLPLISLGAAAVGIVLCVIGLFVNPAQFFRSYLFAYLFWVNMGLGALSIVMIHSLTAGQWGLITRRPLEAAMLTLPLLALLFVPLCFGLSSVYEWADPAKVAADELLQHKAPYLNVPFFLARAAGYFLIWSVLALLMRRWSLAYNRNGDPELQRRLQRLGGIGLGLYGLTVTFAFIDWVMSLEPHWYSTIYSAMVATGGILQAFVLAVLVVLFYAKRPPLVDLLTARLINDLGSLVFAFVMLWAYMAFSQFLLIWAGNLPEEIPWYLRRLAGGWGWVATAILLFHFALPFVLLLSREWKRNLRLVGAVAGLVLLMRLVDSYWLVAPAFSDEGWMVHWLDLATLLAVGGLWTAAFRWLLARQSLLPEGDPRLAEMIEEQEEHHVAPSFH